MVISPLIPEKQSKYIQKFKKVSGTLAERLDDLARQSSTNASLPQDIQRSIESAKSAYSHYRQSFLKLTEAVLKDDSVTPQKANKMMIGYFEFLTNPNHLNGGKK